jgi:hypothetical protein
MKIMTNTIYSSSVIWDNSECSSVKNIQYQWILVWQTIQQAFDICHTKHYLREYENIENQTGFC